MIDNKQYDGKGAHVTRWRIRLKSAGECGVLRAAGDENDLVHVRCSCARARRRPSLDARGGRAVWWFPEKVMDSRTHKSSRLLESLDIVYIANVNCDAIRRQRCCIV
jgi:hypothetical protein